MTWNASLLLFIHQMRKWFGNEFLEALIQMEMEVNFMESDIVASFTPRSQLGVTNLKQRHTSKSLSEPC